MNTQEFTEAIARAMRWRIDVDSEMIECSRSGYYRTHMTYDSISQDELDFICDIVNKVFDFKDSPLRIGNSMGELRPGAIYQRQLFGG